MSVWYCEELDEIRLDYAHEGYLFQDKHGPFHFCFNHGELFKNYKFYWIGDFD